MGPLKGLNLLLFARSRTDQPRENFGILLERCEARIVAFSNLHRALVVGAADDYVSVQYYVEHLCRVLIGGTPRAAGSSLRCLSRRGRIARSAL